MEGGEQRYLEMQAERTKATAVESQRQLASHSGLVSDALEVAARHREVELEAQKVWVDDQLRKLKKGLLDTCSHEASERERNVLALWKEVRSVSEVLAQEQSERRHDTQHAAAAVETLKEKLAAQQEAALKAHETVVGSVQRETSDRVHSHNALRSLLVSQIEGEMDTRKTEVAALKERLSALDVTVEGEQVTRAQADDALTASVAAAESRLSTQVNHAHTQLFFFLWVHVAFTTCPSTPQASGSERGKLSIPSRVRSAAGHGSGGVQGCGGGAARGAGGAIRRAGRQGARAGRRAGGRVERAQGGLRRCTRGAAHGDGAAASRAGRRARRAGGGGGVPHGAFRA